MKRILLTGGCGFIGHHTVEHFLKATDWEIIILDRLTYAGNLNYLTDIEIWEKKNTRVKFIYHDFRAPISETTSKLIGKVDYIVHMGAESHVDRSIDDPVPFAESNVMGTVNMLNYARTLPELEMFVYVSTDEVYGPAYRETEKNTGAEKKPAHGLHLHKEGEPHRPSNPYSASKSGAEAFCYAYWNTYGLPVIITNTMNNFGERQNTEKFIPKTVKGILNGEKVICHVKFDNGEVVDISSRCWLHARNHADGLLFLLDKGTLGERYNISGEWAPVDDMAKRIGRIIGIEPKIAYEDFHSFRPGHDMHYGLDNTKMKEMGWTPPYSLDKSLETTITWMQKNPKWL